MSKEKHIPNRKDMRKELYALFSNILGREITADEHQQIKFIVENYIKSVFSGLEINEKPRTHKLICSECAASKTVIGHKEIKNVYKGKRRGFVAD